MKNKVIILLVLVTIFGLYLNRSYSRIYNRDESQISDISWQNPTIIKNPNFQNTVKYVALGDSLTVGVGTNDRTKTLPYLISQKLAGQMSVSFVNLAVSGATAESLIKNQLNKAVNEKPNYVTILIGTNDLHSLVSVEKYSEEMNHIISYLIKNTQAKIIMFNIPYLGSDSLIVFPYNYLVNYQVERYNQVLTKIAEKNNVTLIDLYKPSKEYFSKQSNFYSSDNFHPSGDGYIMWSNLVPSKDL
ncbi:MAG: SGNH/GDSL hydrolase family protein [Candidatus Daviesbacteria bacterium]|nr:SGNH/GDSL hydrolase family protein [Candidatus Daviesbacteria bacterium]